MKQKTLTMIPLLCAAVAPLCADTQGMYGRNQTQADQQQMYQQEMNKITPIASPCVEDWVDPFVTADFIWWRVQEDGLEYAFTGAGTGLANPTQGKLHHPGFKYDPGFKVGIGGKFRHDGWDVNVQYTWLHNRATDSVTSAAGATTVQSNILVPAGGDLITGFFSSASSTWKNKFNVLDAELGRNFWISKWLTLRPYTGLKFSWNRQRFNAAYNGIALGNEVIPAGILTGDDLTSQMKIKQFGVGLRSGLDTAWYMWKDWSIFGEFAATGMLNYFDSTRKDTNATTGIVLNNIQKISTHRVTAIFEWALGVRFETTWSDDDYMFMLQAGWEQQVWLNQNQFVFFPNSAANDLNFEGCVIKAGLYF